MPLICLLWILLTTLGWAAEGQLQGYEFERAVLAFHDPVTTGYTTEWDLPASANRERPGIPASIKFIEVGNAVYFGDAIRQRTIEEPFQIIIGFWERDIPNKVARVHSVYVIDMTPEKWRDQFGQVTADELRELHHKVHGGSLEVARAYATPRAAELRAKSNGMKINPKLDKSQRRIQCSMDYKTFCERFVGQSTPPAQRPLLLYGKPFPETLALGSRVLKEEG